MEKTEIGQLFEPDNVRDGLSNTKLRALGGIIGIAKSM